MSITFDKLITYLGTDIDRFGEVEASYFARLGELLAFHGVVANPADVTRDTFDGPVGDFQRDRGLHADGIPGENTLWALQEKWAEQRQLDLVRVDTDRWTPPGAPRHVDDNHGYGVMTVRADVAPAVEALRDELHAAGAILTTSGAVRSLSAPVSAGRSVTSIHYSAAAFDVATVSGMRLSEGGDPTNQPYVVVKDGPRWQVFVRAAAGQTLTLDAVTWRNEATSTRSVTGQFLDFTAMARAHGFARIGHRSDFPGNYTSAEWWHMQSEQALVPFISQFGAEIISLASISLHDLEGKPRMFAARKKIFQRATNGWH